MDETLPPPGAPTASPLGSICVTVLYDMGNDDVVGVADAPMPEVDEDGPLLGGSIDDVDSMILE